MTQRWKATWIDRMGRARVLIFRAAPSRMYARLDFQLRLLDRGERIPERFDLEEKSLLPLRPIRLLQADSFLVQVGF